ncbi:MAG: TauD/TfdA family dioxygenase [Hyphomonadaceae bacterium]|nr:TauD/TfdA family dioxygenase [Hyphomonadaceae bacterium]
MAIRTLGIRQLAPTFAAEISRLNLALPLAPRDLTAVVEALDRYGVAVFPGQNLTMQQQIAFSELLGPLENSDEGSPTYQEFRREHEFADGRVSEVSNLVRGGDLLELADMRRLYQFANELWHSDSTFRPVRARYTILSAVKVPASGGDTEFADVVGAYDALPADIKEDIESLVGVHSPTAVMETLGALQADGGGFQSTYGLQRRPLVETHPGSGRRFLSVPSHCSHIEGMSLPEGRSLLFYLREHATQPRFRYRHAWTPGDLVVWDDRSTLHRACRYKERNEPRQLVRTVVQDR